MYKLKKQNTSYYFVTNRNDCKKVSFSQRCNTLKDHFDNNRISCQLSSLQMDYYDYAQVERNNNKHDRIIVNSIF